MTSPALPTTPPDDDAPIPGSSLGGHLSDAAGAIGVAEIDGAGTVTKFDGEAGVVTGLEPALVLDRPLSVLIGLLQARAKHRPALEPLRLGVEVEFDGARVSAVLRHNDYFSHFSQAVMQDREDLANITSFLDGLITDLRAEDVEHRMASRLAESLDADGAILLTRSGESGGLKVSGWSGKRFARLGSVRVASNDFDLPPGPALGRALAEELHLGPADGLVGSALGRSGGFALVATRLDGDPDRDAFTTARAADFLASVGQEMVLVLEDARLTRLVEAARRRADAVREIAQAISQSLDPLQVWHAFAARLRTHLPFDLLALGHRAPGRTGDLDFGLVDGAAEAPAPAPLSLTAGTGSLVDRALDANAPATSHDLRLSPSEGDRVLAARGLAGAVAVPLVARAASAGVLLVARRRAGSPSQDELLLIEQAAAHLAPALANARAFQDLSRVHAELDATARAKDTLSSLLVHDLKSPLAVTLANLEYIRENQFLRDSPEAMNAVNESHASLSGVVERMSDLLDIARLEGERMPCVKRPTDVAALIENVVPALSFWARRARVKIVTNTVPGRFAMDAALMTRVLRNLVANALRFTPKNGTVEITASAVEHGLELRVVDDGPGIPPDHASQLFAKFARFHGESNVTGHGLGLYFVRLATEAHGGVVRADQVPGSGACFVVTLPGELIPP